MQILRTIVWVLVLVALLGFSYFNWRPVEVQIWENMVVETKVPALVIVAFLLGMVPMWLVHRGVRWNLNRRIANLENAAKANSMALSRAQESEKEAAATPPPAPSSPPPADTDPALSAEEPAKDKE